MKVFSRAATRRSMLMAAVAAVAGTAHAQSSITLYGVIDTNVEYINNQSSTGPTVPPGPAANRFALISGGIGGSRWGIRGVEDLGGGLKGIFVLENGFTVDDGKAAMAGRLFGRQAFVGLESNYGKLLFGRQYSTLLDTLADFSPTALQPQYEPVVALLGRYLREDNTIKYSGKYGPLTVGAHWSFGIDTASPATAGEVPGKFRSGSAWGAGANYKSGPFGIGLAYDEVSPAATANGDPGKNRRAAVGASYFGNNFRVMGGYRWGRSTSPTEVEVLRDNFYWLGGVYTLSPAIELSLAYYYDDIMQVTNPVSNATLGNIKNPWQVQFTTKYFLSKRTSVYLATAYAKNAGLNFDTSTGGLGTGYYLGAGKTSQIGVAAGIRHIF